MTGEQRALTVDVPLALGPDHPSAHGMFRIALAVQGDLIVAADPLVGHLHRGVEKLFEVRDYRQILALANRHDWLAAFGNELGVAMAAAAGGDTAFGQRALELFAETLERGWGGEDDAVLLRTALAKIAERKPG